MKILRFNTSRLRNTFNEQIDVAISRSGFEKTNLIHLLTGHELEDIVDFDLNPVGKGYMFFGKSNPRIQHITEGKEMLFDIISNLGGHRDYIQFPLIQQAWAEKYKHALDETTLRKYFKKESLFSVFQMLLPEEVDIQSGSVKLRMSLQEAKLIWIKKMDSEIKKEEKLERRQKIQESRLKLETTKKSQEPQLVPTLPSLLFAALKPPSYSPTQPSESRPASAYGEPPKRVLALQQAQNPKPIQVQQRPQSLVEVMKRNKNFEFLGDKENAHPKLETKENQLKQETPSWGHGSLGESGRFKTPEPKVKWTHPGDGYYTDDDDNVTLKDCPVSKSVPSNANSTQSRQIPSQTMKVTQIRNVR
uniref:Uncharacterized protein n=1 Tax=Acrobeloides nanus TaxID=290746 RepID=A0A914DL52_9BILA